MNRISLTVLRIAAVVFLAALPWSSANAQTAPAPDAPLADQLKAQYKLTKFGADANGFAVLTTGTILTIQKGGILGVPPANLTLGNSIYKDGELHQPTAGNRMLLGNVTRFLTIGEKVYVAKVDVNPKTDRVALTIVECDSCNGVNQTELYKGVVSFEFAKGSLATMDPGQVEDAIGQVFSIDDGSNGGNANGNGGQQSQDSQQQQQGPPQGQQDQQAQQQAQQQQAPPPQPASIQMGQSPDQVQAALGPPDKIVTIGTKQIYVYKDLKVTFVNGKVTDAQ
jgi:hypothetical protein